MDIAIFTCRFGMGHLAQAKALHNQLASRYVVEVVDVMETLVPWGAGEIYRLYGKTMTKPGLMWKWYQRQRLTEPVNVEKLKLLKRRMEVCMKAYEQVPVWIATHSATAYFLAQYRRCHHLQNQLITCLTDVVPHDLWINEGTALYLVPAAATGERLMARGVEAERILVYGLGEVAQVKKEKEGAGFHLLITGGGLGILPEDVEFYRTLQVLTHGDLRIICGKNRKLYQKLKRARLPRTTVYAFVDNMEEHWAWAHVYVGKPGGLSTFEAIRTETPILYVKPFLTQERGNSEFILQEGIGWALEEADLRKVAKDLCHWEGCRANMEALKHSFRPEKLWDFLEVGV